MGKLGPRSSVEAFAAEIMMRGQFTAGPIMGRPGPVTDATTGLLPVEFHAGAFTALWVGYSYDTPVIWEVPGGEWVAPKATYGTTTGGHRGKLVRAVKSLGLTVHEPKPVAKVVPVSAPLEPSAAEIRDAEEALRLWLPNDAPSYFRARAVLAQTRDAEKLKEWLAGLLADRSGAHYDTLEQTSGRGNRAEFELIAARYGHVVHAVSAVVLAESLDCANELGWQR